MSIEAFKKKVVAVIAAVAIAVCFALTAYVSVVAFGDVTEEQGGISTQAAGDVTVGLKDLMER